MIDTTFENIEEKGEVAQNQQLSLFPLCQIWSQLDTSAGDDFEVLLCVGNGYINRFW